VLEPSFRTVTALSISIVPGKATRKHTRTVITGKCKGASASGGKGKMTILDDDGTELELDAVWGKGKPDSVGRTIKPGDIDTRLDLLGASASDDRKALLAEMKADRETAKEERLANLESKAPPGAKEKVQNARNKGKPDSSGGSSGGGSTGGGKPNDKGKPTATSGGSSSSGGGSSNSGGGGGKPDDKGKPDK
jgi:hypothetical protein